MRLRRHRVHRLLAAWALVGGACQPKAAETTDDIATSENTTGEPEALDQIQECAPEACADIIDETEFSLCVLERLRSGVPSSFFGGICITSADEWAFRFAAPGDGTVTSVTHSVLDSAEGLVHRDAIRRCTIDIAKVEALIEVCQEKGCGCFFEASPESYSNDCEALPSVMCGG